MNQGQKLNSLIRKQDGLQEQITAIVIEQRAALQREIRTLDRLTNGVKGSHRPIMSAAARARQSRAAKKRWKQVREAGKNHL